MFDPRTLTGGIDSYDTALLLEYKHRAERIVNELLRLNQPVHLSKVIDLVFNPDGRQDQIPNVLQAIVLSIVHDRERHQAGLIVERTRWKNARWSNDFGNYVRAELGKDTLLSDLKPIHIRAFSQWLQTRRHDPKRATCEPLSRNAAESTATHAKAMAKFWFDSGWLTSNPFQNFRRQLQPVELKVLTEEEVRRLFDLSLESVSLATIRDVFIFMALTGLNYADIERLTSKSIKQDKDRLMLEVTRRKMQNRPGRPALIPLDPTALALLARYWPGDDDGTRPLFPVQRNAAFNRNLKQLAGMANIDKPLSTKFARSTLANYALSKGLPNPTISAILGHSDLGTLLRSYARHQPGRILDDFGQMLDNQPGKTLYDL